MDTQTETKEDRRQRLQQRNDRNSLITALFGVAVVLIGLFVGATSTDATGGVVILVLGAVAFVTGFFNRGRPVR